MFNASASSPRDSSTVCDSMYESQSVNESRTEGSGRRAPRELRARGTPDVRARRDAFVGSGRDDAFVRSIVRAYIPRSIMSAREVARAAVRAAERAASAPHALRVHMSNRYVYAQIVRRTDGHIVASASTIERAFDDMVSSSASSSASGRASRSDKRAAAAVGETLAARARRADVDAVRWHRPYGKRFHGKIKSLMDALVAGGVGLT